VAPDDAAALATGRELVALFESGTDKMTVGELEEAIDQSSATGPLVAPLSKLLFDGCDEEQPSDELESVRWNALLAAEALRRSEAPATAEAFQVQLGQRLARDFESVRSSLYADLPAYRRVTGFKTTTAEALIARYNVAQIQGLLLRARKMTVKVKQATLGERRELFRQVKFHRLMVDVLQPGTDGGVLELELGGPLSLFEQASSYGLRLASFFPHVLHLPQFEVTAEVHIKRKDLTLKVDQKLGLKSHYTKQTRHVPEELTAFVETFNARSKTWQVAPGAEFVHIGRQSYCFPDLTITGTQGERRHVELFHKWHAGQLAGRLQAVAAGGVSDLLIGVAKGLAQREEVAAALAGSGWFAKFGFVFSEFPTPRTLLAALERA
jgi:predicted nuclease of restriction endonuclease-like RecB superfamily